MFSGSEFLSNFLICFLEGSDSDEHSEIDNLPQKPGAEREFRFEIIEMVK